jgi:hypothetical protein
MYGRYRYRCHGCGSSLSLVRLSASVVSGTLADPSGPSAERWGLRLWHEAGVAPVPVPMPVLPTGYSASVRTVAEGFALLCAVRAAAGDTDPVPYTLGFAAEWTELSESTTARGLRVLRSAGWLDPVGGWTRATGFLYRSTTITTTHCQEAVAA